MTSENDKLQEALSLLGNKASELFDDPVAAESFRKLLRQAHSHDASQEGQMVPPHLDELQALVHTVVTIEDSIQDVRLAADLVLDWIAKSGRSLGLD